MMILRKSMMILLLSLILLAGCRDKSHNIQQLNTKSDQLQQPSKHVILLIADSIMDKTLREAINNGNAPAFEFLMKRGRYFPDVVSAFPTMSVTVDSTLLTGSNPDQHHIPGLVWYNTKEKRIINYGTGIREVLKLGPNQVLTDSLFQLNNVHLNPDVQTIHEQLAEKGKQSASINTLIYRGNTKHMLKIPDLIASITLLPKELETRGPRWFSLGVLSQLSPSNQWNALLWRSYGFNDKFSAEELKFLIKERKLPDFTIAYFPNNDFTVHKKGPNTLKGIQEADKQLQEILNTYGSWEESLKNTIWIVMGDSGQAVIDRNREKAIINLNQRLGLYKIANLSQPVTEKDQVVTCVNERMAYVYTLSPDLPLSKLAEHLRQDERIDVIAWKEDNGIRVMSGGKDKTLFYRANGKYHDPYNQTWSLQGEYNILDISVNENDARIHYDAYPDVLKRLHSSLNSHEGNFLVVTAKPGYEFVGESSPTHIGGGGHGSLHKQDSLVPLIITGTESIPEYLRIVDVKQWILQLLKE